MMMSAKMDYTAELAAIVPEEGRPTASPNTQAIPAPPVMP